MEPLDPLLVVLLDGKAKCHLSLFEEKGQQRWVNVRHGNRMPPRRAVLAGVGRMMKVDLLTGIGVMVAVGGGVRAVIAVVAIRERERTGVVHDPHQAQRATWIYGSATLAGLVLIAVSRAV